jgi:acyl-CoA thioester hydrolase
MNPELIPNPDLFRHSAPMQIRFNDVDVLGHMNNTVYFTLYDTAKADYFAAVRGEKLDWKHVDIVVANVNCAYIAPIFFGEEIEVLTACSSISEKSFKLIQMIREKNTLEPKSFCETIMVSFNPETQKASEMPEVWKRMLCDFEQKDLIKRKMM